MADPLVSVLLDQLASIVLRQAEQEVRLVVGVEKEVTKLTSNLLTIQAVLEDAERRRVKDATVKHWIDELKGVSYDMVDVMDEWNTAILKMQIEGDENASMPQRKVCSFIPSSCFCFRQVDLRPDIAVKIKLLNERLDIIAIERNRYSFHLPRVNEELDRQMTVSIINVLEVHGRDQDKNTVVEMLLSESSLGPTPRIISVVGMGGIGKTTLAQLVYNDDAVKAHFDQRIWVCVSDPFDEIRIAKAILEALTYDAPTINELEHLLRQISRSIEGKRFLLVLDDVWTEDPIKWKILKNSLMYGSPGSKILVTTRKEGVANIIGATDMFRLGQLSNKDCWSLFSQVAFLGRTSEECEDLNDIARGIADKCKGLPHAAKVLGSLLRFKSTREEWQSVLDNEVWKLEEAEMSLFPTLLSSYYDLSPTMRKCFLYCAIFPKDYKIEKDRLIKLWMAQGYLGATKHRDMETVGEECFRNLAMRSFFQDVERDSLGTITCKMHNIMHDFVQFLTQNEFYVMRVSHPEEQRLDFSQVEAYHSTIILAERVSIPAAIFKLKNLHSLIVEYKNLPLTSIALSDVFDQLTCLRTLEFINCDYYGCSLTKLPKEIGKLIHLRNLNLANNDKLKNLPETVCDLCNLQSLNVSRCRGIRKLPHGLGKLINLRHLEISSTGVSFMPKGVERLTCLQILDTFYVSSAGNVYEASTLEDLEKLNHLRGNLEISGLGKVRDMDEVKKAQLTEKIDLIGLVLDFSREEAEGRMINDDQVIEALQPPPNLEELSIVYYRGTSGFPNWMMLLTKLKKVQICQYPNCEFLPPLGKLCSLESVIIGRVKTKNLVAEGGMGRVKSVGIEFLGIEADVNENEGPSSSAVIAFPKLQDICFQCMFEWEEWDYGVIGRMKEEEEEDITTVNMIKIMPCLRSLKIRFCPKLKALPDHLFHTRLLEVLEISFCPILEEHYYKERRGDNWHKISHIPNIIINYGYVQKDGCLVP